MSGNNDLCDWSRNIKDINDAYARMLKSDVKYRFVIDIASLGKD